MHHLHLRKTLLIICLLFICQQPLYSQTDTLSKLSERITPNDTESSINMLHKFTWHVTIWWHKGDSHEATTRRPDTLFNEKIDSAHLTASFVLAPALVQQYVSLHYRLEGSVAVDINGRCVLATGKYQPNQSLPSADVIINGFRDFLLADTVQHISISYLPFEPSKLFDMQLRLYPQAEAESKRASANADSKQSYGLGFYYLAFGIVFITLFLFLREKREYLYFGLFCIFAAAAPLWREIPTHALYALTPFFRVFSFEFLSIFFCKVLLNKEKTKIPLLIIAAIMAVCFLPVIRNTVVYVFFSYSRIILEYIYATLFSYATISALYFLVRGIGQKRWEAKALLVICLIPVAVFILYLIVFVIVAAYTHARPEVTNFLGTWLDYVLDSILYVYPLAAVYILGRRNGLDQKQLVAQVVSIQKLSEENLARETEKKQILENQKEALEKEVALRTTEIVTQKEEIEKQHAELKVEKQKSDDLLRNILPEEVAEELKTTGHSDARLYDNVTVLFADFVDFTKAGEAMTPRELVSELHICFKTFDEIISRYGIEKIKTIGDAYLAVCGLPIPDPQHAEKMVGAAMEITAFMKQRHAEMGDKTFRVRVGVHSGSVVAGIVGVKKFAYDIWGDTVNTAARMEQHSESGKVNISQTTYELIKDAFHCQYRGEIEAKNKGMLKMYYVD